MKQNQQAAAASTDMSALQGPAEQSQHYSASARASQGEGNAVQGQMQLAIYWHTATVQELIDRYIPKPDKAE